MLGRGHDKTVTVTRAVIVYSGSIETKAAAHHRAENGLERELGARMKFIKCICTGMLPSERLRSGGLGDISRTDGNSTDGLRGGGYRNEY